MQYFRKVLRFFVLCFCHYQLVSFTLAEQSRVFSAAEISASNGKYCDRKSLVDIHAHVGCLDDGGKTCFISKRLKKERVALGLIGKYRSFFDAFGVSEETLKKQGSEYFFKYVSEYISKSTCVQALVMLALDGSYQFDSEQVDYDNTDFMVRNDFVAENVKKYKNLFWAASINPYRRDYAQELERSYQAGALFVKLIPPIQAIDISAEDQKIVNRITDFYKLLAKYHMPLLIHLDEEGTFSKYLEDKFRKYVGLTGIELALKNGVTVIVAHVATRDSVDYNSKDSNNKTYQELKLLMAKDEYRNQLYADISALPTIVTRTKDLCRVVKDFADREDRLLWGSDYPLNHWKTTSTLIVGVSCDRSFLSITADEDYAFSRKRHQWDRGIFLQKNMGAKDLIFNNTRKFLIEKNLLTLDSNGELVNVAR